MSSEQESVAQLSAALEASQAKVAELTADVQRLNLANAQLRVQVESLKKDVWHETRYVIAMKMYVEQMAAYYAGKPLPYPPTTPEEQRP